MVDDKPALGPGVLTCRQAAAALGISMARLRVLLAAGRIAGAQKPGRDWLIPAPVRVLPPPSRRRACPWASCQHNFRDPDGGRRCALGLVGIPGRACPAYVPRPGLSPAARPIWAQAKTHG